MPKKIELDNKTKGLILGELKRFVTIINKYFPAGKNKKEILKKFEEIVELVEKSIWGELLWVKYI